MFFAQTFESEIFEEFTMELVIDEKGRKVINVPFLELERNEKWNEEKEMPYLKPSEEFIKPADLVELEKVGVLFPDFFLILKVGETRG